VRRERRLGRRRVVAREVGEQVSSVHYPAISFLDFGNPSSTGTPASLRR
jgi:hypothetical protein